MQNLLRLYVESELVPFKINGIYVANGGGFPGVQIHRPFHEVCGLTWLSSVTCWLVFSKMCIIILSRFIPQLFCINKIEKGEGWAQMWSVFFVLSLSIEVTTIYMNETIASLKELTAFCYKKKRKQFLPPWSNHCELCGSFLLVVFYLVFFLSHSCDHSAIFWKYKSEAILPLLKMLPWLPII